MTDWKTGIEKEFQMAASARARDNEGQARVCARRAAGVAIREYFARRGIRAVSPSAYDLLQSLMEMDDLPPDLRRRAGYLTLRVNEEFSLPVEVDLVEEARTLCEQLLPEAFK